MKSTSLRALREFFQASLSDLELRQLAMELVGTADGLPGKTASLAAVVQATVDVLQRAGAIDDDLFEYLGKALPRRVHEVDLLRRQYVGQVTPVAHTLVKRGEVYTSLKRLTPSQFSEVVFTLGIDSSPHIAGPNETLAVRAQELIRLMEQQQDGLAILADAVASVPTISARPSPPSPSESSAMTSPIKILLVCANPRGTDQLRLGEEDRTLRESIQLSTNRERFDVSTLNAATIDDLRRELLRHKYDIVQISGHGTHAGLMFEDVKGGRMVPDSAALAELLQRRGVKTVVLNACYSLSAGSFGGVGIEYTIAMEGPIADRSAIEFSRGFYDALGEGLEVADAYAEGVSCCKLKGLSLSAALLKKGELSSGATPSPGISSVNESGESQRSLLLGIAIDTSGSMQSSIYNDQRGSLTRLSSVKQGLARLARSIQKQVKVRATGTRSDLDFKMFIYAFGLRHTSVADLLTVVRATEQVDILDEIERRKRHHEAEARRNFAGLQGLGALARSYGFGSIVNELEDSARAGAEARIRQRIVSELAELILQKVRELGDTTFRPGELAELFERPSDRDLLEEVEPLIYGGTPMLAVTKEIRGRFGREGLRPDEDRLLLMVSDGEPTDGEPAAEFEEIKRNGVTIIACYVTDADVSDPRLLLAHPEPSWPPGARLMFEAASPIDEKGPFAQHLLRKGWRIETGARLFVQVNHSEVLEEFIQIAGSPYGQPALPKGR